MEKQMGKIRTIRFFSQKNQEVLIVHSALAKKFAEHLEKDSAVKKYQTNVALENWKEYVSSAGIRKSYLTCEWTSDFLIEDENAQVSVREIVSASDLDKRAEVEKLEISRRYWKSVNVFSWQAVIVEE